MHVAFVIYGSLDEISGGFLYDRQLVAQLRQRGHQVTLVTLPWRSYARSLYDNLSPHLLHTLRNPAFDLILQDELVHPSFFQCNWRLRRATRRPIVSLIHLLRSSEPGSPGQRLLSQWVERRYLASVDGFIYVNRHIATRVHALLHTKPRGIVAHPAGDHFSTDLTSAQITHRAQSSRSLNLIFVGNLTPLKHLHFVLAALHHVPTAMWRLLVIGSLERAPAYVRRIRHEIARAGWQDHVTLLGTLSHDEVGSHLARGHVFVVPSNPESYSIAYLEAMQYGLPIMAHAQSDSADLIEHGISGFCIQPGDIHGFARHLHTLAQDRQRLAHMSLAARKRFASLPTWNQSMPRAARFLEEIFAAQRG